MDVTRREVLGVAAAAGATACLASPGLASTVFARPMPFQPRVNPILLERARAALEAKRPYIRRADVMAVVDFSRLSRDPRFFLVNVHSGTVTQYHVAHGRGSDPYHLGWLQYFSNMIGSEASSNGAYVTDHIYYGRYGRSLKLRGLDYSNSNAEERAIVVHSAKYAEPEVIAQHGKLGRSEGCFALSELSLQYVLQQLGPGRMIYADKL